MGNKISYCLINDQVLEVDKATVSVQSRGYMYGDGCFATIRNYKGRCLHLTEHITRLNEGIEFLGLAPKLTQEETEIKIAKILLANDLNHSECVVRIQVSRVGEGGYYSDSKSYNLSITCGNVPKVLSDISLATVPTRVIPEQSLSRKVKLTNSLNYVVAARQASALNADDALMLTVNNKISETSKANLFWVKGNKVFTPSIDCDLLPGIFRGVLIKLLSEEKDYELVEGEFDSSQIIESDCVFCCNSIREITPISSIDTKTFSFAHPFFKELNMLISEYKSTHLKKIKDV